MKICFSTTAWDDYLYWQQNDKKNFRRINELVKDIQRNKYTGIGKPEALKHNLSGYWSRRINLKHRIIYRIKNDKLFIAQLRYHYLNN